MDGWKSGWVDVWMDSCCLDEWVLVFFRAHGGEEGLRWVGQQRKRNIKSGWVEMDEILLCSFGSLSKLVCLAGWIG